jgi:hypothetical protein
MIGFAEVYAALQAGKQVRRKRWDRGSALFVQSGELMYSCRGNVASKASSDVLDWRDMNAEDWSILPAA